MTLSDFEARFVYDPSSDQLGVGGFGTVYKAWDTKEKAHVAIKEMQVKDHKFTLQREVELANAIPPHLNIARYGTAYRFSMGRSVEMDYAVLKYYLHGNLDKVLTTGDLTPEERTVIIRGILEGLAHLHRAGVIHRDLKASNILMDRDAGHWVPKISDLGLSKVASGKTGEGTTNSSVGISYAYAAPEQIRSLNSEKGGHIRPNVDLWAVGVLIYKIWIGELPFWPEGNERSTGSDLVEISKRILSGKLPSKLAQVPEPFQAMIRRCLVQDPSERVQKAEELLSMMGQPFEFPESADPHMTLEVERVQLDKEKAVQDPVLAAGNPNRLNNGGLTENPPEPFWRKNKALVAIAAVGLLSLGGWWMSQQSTWAAERQARAETEQHIQDSLAIRGRFVQDSLDNERMLAEKEQRRQDSLVQVRALAEREQRRLDSLERVADMNDPFRGTMVRIQGGTFQMGSSNGGTDERPRHQVSVGDFWMGKHEVTQAQWREIMGSNPSQNSSCSQCPVENVSWNDVQEFIRRLNAKTGRSYRLPTEAEWEYAAGGGSGSRTTWPGVNSESSLQSFAWFYDNSGKKPRPVGQKQPNRLGLYDMAGNVWEYCSDWYSEDYYRRSAPSNPRGPGSGTFRVYRGGSSTSDAAKCTASYRYRSTPTNRGSEVGFRLVR